MSWTDERINTLKKMWQSGKSASEIAEKLGGVTRNAVIGKAHRLGLSGRPSPIKPPRVVKKTAAVVPKKPQSVQSSKIAAPAPAKKPVILPKAVVPTAVKPSKPANIIHGKSMPPSEAPPLAALANATSRADGSLISILEVSERLCRWPVGDPKEPGFGYCGSDVLNGHVYCGEHVAIAFQAPNRKDKKQITAKVATKTEVPDLEDLEVEVEDDEAEEEEVVEDDDDDTPISPVVAI